MCPVKLCPWSFLSFFHAYDAYSITIKVTPIHAFFPGCSFFSVLVNTSARTSMRHVYIFVCMFPSLSTPPTFHILHPPQSRNRNDNNDLSCFCFFYYSTFPLILIQGHIHHNNDNSSTAKVKGKGGVRERRQRKKKKRRLEMEKKKKEKKKRNEKQRKTAVKTNNKQ